MAPPPDRRPSLATLVLEGMLEVSFKISFGRLQSAVLLSLEVDDDSYCSRRIGGTVSCLD